MGSLIQVGTQEIGADSVSLREPGTSSAGKASGEYCAFNERQRGRALLERCTRLEYLTVTAPNYFVGSAQQRTYQLIIALVELLREELPDTA